MEPSGQSFGQYYSGITGRPRAGGDSGVERVQPEKRKEKVADLHHGSAFRIRKRHRNAHAFPVWSEQAHCPIWGVNRLDAIHKDACPNCLTFKMPWRNTS